MTARLLFVFSLGGLLLIVLLSSVLRSPRQLHDLLASEGSRMVRYDDTQVPLRVLLEDSAREDLEPWERPLYDLGRDVLWLSSYALAGASGAIVWLWLMLAQLSPQSPDGVPGGVTVLARIGVGAAAGFLTYFISKGALWGLGLLCHAHHNVATRTRMAGGNVQRNLRTGLFRALGGMVQDSSRSARATLGGWWIVGGHSMRALACAAIATTAFGQTQPGTDPWFRGFDLRLTYYECIRPAEEPPCVALTEEEQEERCPGCLEWRLEVLGNRVVVEFDRSAYLLADPVARESAFVRDFAEAAYGAGSFPLREDGSAVTTGDLFRNYERVRMGETGSWK